MKEENKIVIGNRGNKNEENRKKRLIEGRKLKGGKGGRKVKERVGGRKKKGK